MRLADAFHIAQTNLKRTKLRTFLTTSGVVISIAAITLLVSISIGLEQLSVKRIASLNALTRLSVLPKENSSSKLDEAALSKLTTLPHVVFASPEVQFPVRIKIANTQTDAMLTGIKKEYISFSDIEIKKGKTFTNNSAKEILLSTPVLKLFQKENDPGSLIGQEVSLDIITKETSTDLTKILQYKVTIVGTTGEEAISNIYMPLNMLSIPLSYSSVNLKIDQRQNIKSVKTNVENLNLQTSTVSELIDQIDQAFMYFQIIICAIGSIALFVAAIGIINTMTISLLERTREIGIMKALGAKNTDIKRIFIYESAIIGLKGSVYGVIIGWLVGEAVNLLISLLLKANNSQDEIILFIIPFYFAVGIVAASTFLATLAGVYPAKRASKLSPIQALRFE